MVYEQLLPDDRWGFHDHDERLDLILREAVRGVWMRLEYMNARVSNDGRPLGAPRAGVANLRNPFDVTSYQLDDPLDLTPDPAPVASTLVPNSDTVSWNNLNGIKGSFGIPLTKEYTLEASFWGLEEGGGSISVPNIPPTSALGPHGTSPIRWLATTLTTDGVVGDRLILYDLDFFSNYRVNVYSSDVNLLYNIRTRAEGWNLKSLIGYRHDQYSEHLTFGGSFNNNFEFDPSPTADDGAYIAPPYVVPPILPGELAQPNSNRIDSRTHNFRNSLQLGLRSEFVHRWFTLGVEPKVGFGSNHVRARVNTRNARSPGVVVEFEEVVDPDDPTAPPVTVATPIFLDTPADPDVPILASSTNRDLVFAPSVDLGLYVEAHPTDWFTLRFGWNLVWLGQLGVADHGIRFNELTDPADPTNPALTTSDISARIKLRDSVISAFTVGGTIYLP